MSDDLTSKALAARAAFGYTETPEADSVAARAAGQADAIRLVNKVREGDVSPDLVLEALKAYGFIIGDERLRGFCQHLQRVMGGQA